MTIGLRSGWNVLGRFLTGCLVIGLLTPIGARGSASAADSSADWVPLTSATPPPQLLSTQPVTTLRPGIAFAYDASTESLLAFGGYRAPSDGGTDKVYPSDTWAWNDSGWTEEKVAGPPGRSDASMAYDPSTGTILMFGGVAQGKSGTPSLLDDTWLWTGEQWVQQHPTNAPTARQSAALGFDPKSRKLLLFGGEQPGVGGPLSDTWTWTGSNWLRLESAGALSPAYGNVLFLSRDGELSLLDQAAVWSWDGQRWHPFGHGPPSPGNFDFRTDSDRPPVVSGPSAITVISGGQLGSSFAFRTVEGSMQSGSRSCFLQFPAVWTEGKEGWSLESVGPGPIGTPLFFDPRLGGVVTLGIFDENGLSPRDQSAVTGWLFRPGKPSLASVSGCPQAAGEGRGAAAASGRSANSSSVDVEPYAIITGIVILVSGLAALGLWRRRSRARYIEGEYSQHHEIPDARHPVP